MQFINIAMLAGLAAVAVPVVIQLFSRRNTKRVKWGAWIFLDKTMKKRRRKVLLEDILLLACRCLALGLLALAFARPFIRPDSSVPWAVTMPAMLVSIVAFGISFALWRYPKPRFRTMAAGIVLFLLSVATILFERQLDLKRFGLGAAKDVVLVIDGSASMSVKYGGKTNFERAVEEAVKYVELAPRNTAFSVIIGGPVPQVVNPVPVADKRIILSTLEKLNPANGTMQIAGNLAAAAMTLAAGQNAVKQIVIVGDGQTVGWHLDDMSRWKTVQRLFSSLKTQPVITWRTLPLPASMRNLALAEISPLRDIVGTDRPVGISVKVVNSGTEAVTPKRVSLVVEGERKEARDVRQLEPGESQTFEFFHRFKTPGGTILSAEVDCADDLPADDVRRYAMSVADDVKVLLVDGSSGGRLLDRASTYVRLALRPEFSPAAADAGAGRRNYLVSTKVEDVATAGLRRSFAGFSAVVLLGARRLSDETRDALGKFVVNGGGLFYMPDPASDGGFFGEWESEGRKILPAPPGKWRGNSARLDAGSFTDMLGRFRTGTDLRSAVPRKVMEFGEGWTSNSVVLAKLADGTPFILSHTVGSGTVIESAALFDSDSGIVSKRGFVPLVHELVYSLVRPASVKLDVRPADRLTLFVASAGEAESPAEIVEMVDPHAVAFRAEMFREGGGVFLRIARSVVPGVYTVKAVPEAFKACCGNVTDGEGRIRISVSAGVEESTFTAITQAALSELSRHVRISQATKEEDVVKAIGGQSFGKEIWRLVALFAFLFLVAEPAIARWIAINRRTGDAIDSEGVWIRT